MPLYRDLLLSERYGRTDRRTHNGRADDRGADDRWPNYGFFFPDGTDDRCPNYGFTNHRGASGRWPNYGFPDDRGADDRCPNSGRPDDRGADDRCPNYGRTDDPGTNDRCPNYGRTDDRGADDRGADAAAKLVRRPVGAIFVHRSTVRRYSGVGPVRTQSVQQQRSLLLAVSSDVRQYRRYERRSVRRRRRRNLRCGTRHLHVPELQRLVRRVDLQQTRHRPVLPAQMRFVPWYDRRY